VGRGIGQRQNRAGQSLRSSAVTHAALFEAGAPFGTPVAPKVTVVLEFLVRTPARIISNRPAAALTQHAGDAALDVRAPCRACWVFETRRSLALTSANALRFPLVAARRTRTGRDCNLRVSTTPATADAAVLTKVLVASRRAALRMHSPGGGLLRTKTYFSSAATGQRTARRRRATLHVLTGPTTRDLLEADGAGGRPARRTGGGPCADWVTSPTARAPAICLARVIVNRLWQHSYAPPAAQLRRTP